MLVLGRSSDDKGAQLEALIQTTLTAEGFTNVRTNVVGAGANELDVVATKLATIMGASHSTPVLCEAKAYADPINMPAWQRFLGKVFLARLEAPSTIGVFVALSGVNGNVAGSLEQVRRGSADIILIEGSDLVSGAEATGELHVEQDVRERVATSFDRTPGRLEVAYYGGVFYWVIWWKDDEFSVVDGHGTMLTTAQIEALREAADESLSGRLIATEEARVLVEETHAHRVDVLGDLFRRLDVPVSDEDEVIATLASEPFCFTVDDVIRLKEADQLTATDVTRLFVCLLEHPIRVAQLGFVAEHAHDAYVDRLVDVIPDMNAGFHLDLGDQALLKEIAPLFPSIWGMLAAPIAAIASHRIEETDQPSDDLLASDRNFFWDEVTNLVRNDFSSAALRGFLYDQLGVAELEEVKQLTVKSKTSPVATISATNRTAIGSLDEGLIGDAGTNHWLIRLIPNVPQPWEREHPEAPSLTREPPSPAGAAAAAAADDD